MDKSPFYLVWFDRDKEYCYQATAFGDQTKEKEGIDGTDGNSWACWKNYSDALKFAKMNQFHNAYITTELTGTSYKSPAKVNDVLETVREINKG